MNALELHSYRSAIRSGRARADRQGARRNTIIYDPAIAGHFSFLMTTFRQQHHQAFGHRHHALRHRTAGFQ